MKNISNQPWRLLSVTFAIAVFLCSTIMQAQAKDHKSSENQAAQQTPPAASAPPAANPADVATMDAAIGSLYEVISGPAGKKRDWDRFRSLFIPGARMIPTGKRQTGSVGSTVIEPEGYITRSSKVLEEQGFFEKEV